MVLTLQAINAELRRRMHEPSSQVGEWLQKVVRGYFQYHATPGNSRRLYVFVHRIRLLWRQGLFRSQKGTKSWQRITPLFTRWIPEPRVSILTLSSASPPLIQGGSRMRKRARTDLCGGAMS